jgi:apolipoprotein N-acyltransferase
LDRKYVALPQYGLAVLSGVLLTMSYAMQPFWWAAWLAPAPAIIAVMSAPSPHRLWLSLLSGLIAGVSSVSYHVIVGGWFVAFLILALIAIGWSGAIRLSVIFAERRQFHLALLAIPVTWAAVDTLLIYLSPHGSAGSIAYSQMNALPVIQVASLGGMPAISFVVLLGGSLIGLLLAWRSDWNLRQVVVASSLAVLAIGASVSFGMVRLHNVERESGPTIALIAQDGVGKQPRSWDSFWQIYGAEISQVAKPGVIVVLPETTISVPEAAAENLARSFADHAAKSRSTIVAGILLEGLQQRTNRALIARPDGSYRWYVKQHLVPGFEADLTPGTEPLVVPDSLGGIGIAICKDMYYPPLMREYSQHGVRLMLIPANDFEVDDWMASRMTVLRGVESGSSIARAATRGNSFVSDRYGRVLAERRSDTTMTAVIARAPIDPGAITIYAWLGDLFGWVCVLLWAFMLILRYRLFNRPIYNNKD